MPLAMNRLMQGFPPAAQEQVTLANWRTPPFNKWAFHHVREIVPCADIANNPADVMALPEALRELELDEFLETTDTDAFVVLHRGRLLFEYYANGMTADTPHILMSVTKSMLGLLVGVLAARGKLDPERPVTEVLPELAGTGYRGASIRHLLDMRSGIAFDEDYLATSGPIVEYRKSTGWNPPQAGDAPSDLRSFYRQLKDSDGPHGGRFHYVSPNTDLLGWAIERATGRRYADLMSEFIWRPMGAARSAYITVDRLGAPRCAGGMCVTARDLARVGQLILDGGRRGEVAVLPAAWIDDMAKNGDAGAWAAGDFVEYFPGLPMHYRSQWYALNGKSPLLFGWGIYGQNLFVDRRRQIVIAKLSSQALPVDVERMALTLRTAMQIGELLSG
jgi:CubicO group peptidase (beta-lactamase class C family)